jgi:hypothetical protein
MRYLQVCEASYGRAFKKNSPTAIHRTSLFQYYLDTYKAQFSDMVDMTESWTVQ